MLGRDPRREPEVLADVGYVAQDAPLYRSFTVRDTIEFARATNPGWDESIASEFLTRLVRGRARLGADRRASERASRSRVALGKRPALVLLDEPFARLDPLAAREFLQLLMDGVAELEATVVIASHVVADIERVSDHIVLLERRARPARGQRRGAALVAPPADRRGAGRSAGSPASRRSSGSGTAGAR